MRLRKRAKDPCVHAGSYTYTCLPRLSPTENNALQHATPEGFETAGNPVALKGYSQLMGILTGNDPIDLNRLA